MCQVRRELLLARRLPKKPQTLSHLRKPYSRRGRTLVVHAVVVSLELYDLQAKFLSLALMKGSHAK